MKPYLVHMTDIFHPHGDPDDHYDLALAFALHKLGYLELGRVVCDYPPAHRIGDPVVVWCSGICSYGNGKDAIVFEKKQVRRTSSNTCSFSLFVIEYAG